MSINDALGVADLTRLIDHTGGLVSFRLFDSGAHRQGSGHYGWEAAEGDLVRIYALGSQGERTARLIVDQQLALTPQALAFLGLYLGDGAKAGRGPATGIISFSQKEPHLATFVRNQFVSMFGETLTFRHRVGEDGLYFLTDEMRDELRRFRRQLRDQGEQVPTEEEIARELSRELADLTNQQAASTRGALQRYQTRDRLMNSFQQYLVEFLVNRPWMSRYMEEQKRAELEAIGIPLSQNDTLSVNIRLPGVKGAREEGKSSRSDELDVNGLAPFRALFLRIIQDVEQSIEANSPAVHADHAEQPWLQWHGPPHTYARCTISVREYLTAGPSTQWVTSRARHNRYTLAANPEGGITAAKRPSAPSFQIPPTLPLTPLVCFFIGLYLAEGNTKKSNIFRFSREHATRLVLGFSGSENSTLSIYIEAMKHLFRGDHARVQYWRLKVGSKYFWETTAVGNKIGGVVLRRGEKGQGAASGLEIVEHLKEWALQTMPCLQAIADRFDHLEYTGAGIPRVDLFHANSGAVYAFALMRDLIVEPQNLDHFSVALS